MATQSGLRDSALIDALEAMSPTSYDGAVWRVVRSGRDPLQCSSYGGRWDDRTFDVLYAAQMADGAVAEMYFHLSRGQPVFPSKVSYQPFEIGADIDGLLEFPTLQALQDIGVNTSRYGALSYDERAQEYPRTQELAEAVHFIGANGLLVPNARWSCLNLVVFCDRIRPDSLEIISDHGPTVWEAWNL